MEVCDREWSQENLGRVCKDCRGFLNSFNGGRGDWNQLRKCKKSEMVGVLRSGSEQLENEQVQLGRCSGAQGLCSSDFFDGGESTAHSSTNSCRLTLDSHSGVESANWHFILKTCVAVLSSRDTLFTHPLCAR